MIKGDNRMVRTSSVIQEAFLFPREEHRNTEAQLRCCKSQYLGH